MKNIDKIRALDSDALSKSLFNFLWDNFRVLYGVDFDLGKTNINDFENILKEWLNKENESKKKIMVQQSDGSYYEPLTVLFPRMDFYVDLSRNNVDRERN